MISLPAPPRLALRGITKRYPSVLANDGIDLDVGVGEIHALLGENGAGKTTLMKIVSGIVRPDAGSIQWEGQPVSIESPARARMLGIGMVFQHFALFETLTVAENIALAIGAGVHPQQLSARIQEVSESYGLAVDPHRITHSMSVGERQRVEIVRCLLQSPRLLIMDEPTSVLSPQAIARLFETLRRLASEGVSILYISHKLEEILALCDVATVLRAGRVSGAVVPATQTKQSLARMMVGSDIRACQLQPKTPGAAQLEIENLTSTRRDPFGVSLQAVSLQVCAGEIVGIAGVSGNGQQELLAAISGEVLCRQSLHVRICGQAAGRVGPSRRRALGLAFVPEDRLGRGAVPSMSLTLNALLTGARAGLVRWGLIRSGAARRFARQTIDQFGVKCAGESAPAQSLSGGNLQKFIVGREALLGTRILVLAQPTWGVDIGAAALIHQTLIDLRTKGVAVLVVSEELDELFGLCDRIAVIAAGRLSPAQATAQLTLDAVGVMMSGDFATSSRPEPVDALA